MNKVKDVIITVLVGLAVGLGTVAFLLYKLFMHERELRDARSFVQSAPNAQKNEVLKALDVKGNTVEEKAHSLREEVEKETKNEIINSFKKAFGVADPALSGDDNAQRSGD